jgi:hypothetical protein
VNTCDEIFEEFAVSLKDQRCCERKLPRASCGLGGIVAGGKATRSKGRDGGRVRKEKAIGMWEKLEKVHEFGSDYFADGETAVGGVQRKAKNAARRPFNFRILRHFWNFFHPSARGV